MTARQFLNAIERLGHTTSTIAAVLGISRSSAFRYANGDAPVPPYVAKLVMMYERHGVPKDD